jgi:hypothetical protein
MVHERNPIAAAVQLALAIEDDDEPVEDLLGLERTAARVRERTAGLTNAGRGRPPGARNRATQHWVQYLTRKYSSPLEVLAQMANAPIDELAGELHCSRLDAIREKRHAAEALAPYLHPRLQSLEIYPVGDPRGGFLNPSTLILTEQEPLDVTPQEGEEAVARDTPESGELGPDADICDGETSRRREVLLGPENGLDRDDAALDELLERARRDPAMARCIRERLEEGLE